MSNNRFPTSSISIDIGLPLSSNDPPPIDSYHEETEEEFFKDCTADGDFNAAPELSLIKDMLDLVHASDISDKDEDDEEDDIVITKLNPTAPAFISKPDIPKKRKNRNVAISSLLEAIGEAKPDPVVGKPVNESKNPTDFKVFNNSGVSKGNIIVTNLNIEDKENIERSNENTRVIDQKHSKDVVKSPHKYINHVVDQYSTVNNHKAATDLKERKPAAFISKGDTTSSKTDYSVDDEKEKTTLNVNHLLKSQFMSSLKTNPSKMFKKKDKSGRTSSKTCLSSNSSSCEESYKPSGLANEYYQKYLERNIVKEEVKLDLWTKAEQQMKEIDARMKLEAEQITKESLLESPSTSSSTTQERDSQELLGAHLYKLPFHRHIWTDECLVCEMMEKHKHDVKSMKDCPHLLEPPSYLTDKDEEDVS
ncbi:hypothetical protein K1T71_007494 [Dendrolimus kikuchii]|uniref:Uncharacterized protein n=1 Tax=Dendrolimus kikuchii TaxID=765133 RepID=A0ACC1D171_9NEOP|nr:hypothetical protein K1T71_007494 [Dendrolimus kikuchii]